MISGKNGVNRYFTGKNLPNPAAREVIFIMSQQDGS
jgi:hypothetical protein